MFVKSELRSSLSYPDLAKEILSKFISEEEIPRKDLSNIVDKAVQRFLNKNEGMAACRLFSKGLHNY